MREPVKQMLHSQHADGPGGSSRQQQGLRVQDLAQNQVGGIGALLSAVVVRSAVAAVMV
jgi:hypothetical protein